MKLKQYQYPVTSIDWGETTNYQFGTLSINYDDLMKELSQKGDLDQVVITDIELVLPGTNTRVVNIFDVLPAQARLGENSVNYPGVLGPAQTVGDGDSAALENFAVLAISSIEERDNKLLDMAGIGATLTPYSEFFHVAFRAEPKKEISQAVYYLALKKIGLRIGSYLARTAATSQQCPITKTYSLETGDYKLPNAAYVFMIASHQKSETGEPILYGDDVSGLLPTILHPNEVLDGAVIAPFWNLGIDTYTFINNPVLLELYDRHGKDINFTGVVICVAHITREKRARTATMISNLVHEILNSDIAVLTKLGGGIPESDLMAAIELLEENGVSTSSVIWSTMGNGTIKDSLSAHSDAANALASAGIFDETVELPGQEIVVGGTNVDHLISEQSGNYHDAHEPILVHYRHICGAISQLGASKVGMIEV
ncbi:glycine/sarcosine/betaine reductase component B subunit [Bacillus sp. Marseille-P3661]|uniref:glycine/sarcosine/betaine reductase component B subunit n=1 Tax=Bacillus sp. Marseille-P3661 TaxID=1936234 RepID=UPI000C81A8DB|nr:glycine/sarcosine/betaine reductase component B subunit [Bacillus sp. Marseille-P3661]